MLFPWRLFARYVIAQTVIVVLSVGAAGLGARYFYKKQFIGQSSERLHDLLEGLAAAPGGRDYKSWCMASGAGPGRRLTAISAVSGMVLCDSHGDLSQMDNHGGREEILAAKKSGFGTSLRLSGTVHESFLYGALLSGDGHTVLRAALPVSVLARSLHAFDLSLGLVISAVVLVSVVLLLLTGRKSIIATQKETAWEEKERLATLMESISDAIVAVDLNGRPLFFNSRFAMLFDRDKRLGRAGARLEDLFPESTQVYAALKKAEGGGGRPAFSQTAVMLEPTEGGGWYALTLSPLRSGNGIYGVVGMFHDVSDLKKAEQMRIDFVANVSHELRTPLTSIKGYADTAIQTLEAGKGVDRKHLEIISRNADRLVSLIRDLLDLSLLDSAAGIQKQDLSTATVTRHVIDQLESGIRERAHSISVLTRSEFVRGDPDRVEQVLFNLFENAVKYTKRGGRISVSWLPGDGHVVMRVEDNGPGMAAGHLPRLFERFYRVDKSRSREQGGTGLGLAIVKHIMMAHGGDVSVESTPGKGTVFSCRFPA